MKPAPLCVQLERDQNLIPLSLAKTRHNLSDEAMEELTHRLSHGKVDDPLGSAFKQVVYDDDRLERFALNWKPRNKFVSVVLRYWRMITSKLLKSEGQS